MSILKTKLVFLLMIQTTYLMAEAEIPDSEPAIEPAHAWRDSNPTESRIEPPEGIRSMEKQPPVSAERRYVGPLEPKKVPSPRNSWSRVGNGFPFGQFESSTEDWQINGNVLNLSKETVDRLELSVWQLEAGKWTRERMVQGRVKHPLPVDGQIWGYDKSSRTWYFLAKVPDLTSEKPLSQERAANVAFIRNRMRPSKTGD